MDIKEKIDEKYLELREKLKIRCGTNIPKTKDYVGWELYGTLKAFAYFKCLLEEDKKPNTLTKV